MFSNRMLIVLIVILNGGCGDDRDADAAGGLPVTSLPGVYSGDFPCDGCPGIHTTLWLRADGRFFIEQDYPAIVGRPAMMAYSLGRWRWDGADRVAVLAGAGPERVFERLDGDTLAMRTDSDLPYRLGRDAETTSFDATIRMAGMVRNRDESTTFTECLTGFEVPVGRGGDYGRFLHQYRSLAVPGKPTYIELNGHFSWSDAGAPQSLVIERFLTIKPDAGC